MCALTTSAGTPVCMMHRSGARAELGRTRCDPRGGQKGRTAGRKRACTCAWRRGGRDGENVGASRQTDAKTDNHRDIDTETEV